MIQSRMLRYSRSVFSTRIVRQRIRSQEREHLAESHAARLLRRLDVHELPHDREPMLMGVLREAVFS